MIAPVVAGTSHTLVTRRPCADACGTRVQTMPLALATSIAATRATSCSYSSSWISCGSCIAGPSPPSPWARYQGCPGASVGNRKSEPRAPSTVRDPSRSRPRRQTDSTASATRNAPASAGNPARFSRPHGVPRRDMETDRKITALTGVGGSSRRSRLWVGMWLSGWSGCCWGEGDGEPQGLQLPDVVAGLLVLVDAAGVVAGAEVVVAGGGVGQQMPDDHQDGAGDGDQGLELAATPDQAPVALAQEGVGLGGSRPPGPQTTVRAVRPPGRARRRGL